MRSEDIQKRIGFYKSQIKIIWIGGATSILLILLGLYNPIFVLISMLIMAITFWVCERREIKFKKNETTNNKH